MFKVFVTSSDRAFSEKIKRILPDNTKLSYGNRSSNGDRINKALAGGSDLIFIDFEYILCLRNILPKAKVIIASDKYDRRKEYLSARLGARGFITKDIERQSLRKAINAVNSNQVWMTRLIATIVFKEYGRILKEDR